jgi:CRP/FNR family cyclic AMP-dependent transcriptional regulator
MRHRPSKAQTRDITAKGKLVLQNPPQQAHKTIDPRTAGGQSLGFNLQVFLSSIGEGKRVLRFRKKQTIFAQGDPADAVFYVHRGKVKLTVLSKTGKEATIAIVDHQAFFGEAALAGQTYRIGSAIAVTDCDLLRIDKKTMLEMLHREPEFSEMFVTYLLVRNVRYEADLIDQLFNSSEKRLARTLLLLARIGREGEVKRVVPKITQEVLAEMIGTTRSRVSIFMNRFRRLGFIHYNGGLEVHSSLLSVVLHD